jgi:hypothetical protein
VEERWGYDGICSTVLSPLAQETTIEFATIYHMWVVGLGVDDINFPSRGAKNKSSGF